jgi:hypothetical protein
LKNEIDKMIVNLERHDPEIKLEDQKIKCQKFSELSNIFDNKDLEKAFSGFEWNEKQYVAKE